MIANSIITSLIVYLLVNICMATERNLTTVVNPECHEPVCSWKNGSSPLLVYVQADGANDTVHHLWDFTGSPSLLLVYTKRNCKMNVNWKEYIKGNKSSITFNNKLGYTYGVILDKVFEFKDENDNGIFDENNKNESYVHVMNTNDFYWNIEQPLVNDTDRVLLSLIGKKHHQEANKPHGLIRITMGAYGGSDHCNTSPHLLHSSNSSQMDFMLENMPTSSKKSRYGLSLLMFSSDHSNSSMALDVRKTLDDEQTPGVFEVVEITSPEVKNISNTINSGYIQWRPVVFTSQSHEVSNSSDTVQYNISALTDVNRIKQTLFYKLYGDDISDYLVSYTYVTFGASGDKFYRKTNFTSWTFVVGVGHPFEEGFSNLVLMILAIGIGLPILLIIFGGVCLVVRRVMRKKDDLFLGQ